MGSNLWQSRLQRAAQWLRVFRLRKPAHGFHRRIWGRQHESDNRGDNVKECRRSFRRSYLRGGTPINWTGPVKIFGGMSSQAYQSASGTVYEAQNSLAYRVAWQSQIALGSSLGNVMIVTWNDFGEHTAIEPSQDQYGNPSRGFYNLTGYYTTWLYNGSAPAITGDAILYFYRKQTYAAAHAATISGLTTRPTMVSYDTPSDNIEMIAFLASPATLSITINGITNDAGRNQRGSMSSPSHS